MSTEYNESTIQVLKGLESVRVRPGMYLGNTANGDALHKCLDEVLDNSVDEHLAGKCWNIKVALQPDGYVEIHDDGRGIPVGLHAEEKRSTLEVILCTLAAGGKFDDTDGRVSAGLHGVGVSAVNAVSEDMTAWVYRDGHVWEQSYAKGLPTSEVVATGETTRTGTVIRWKRDLSIFEGDVEYSYDRVHRRCEELAFLNPGLTIELEDERAAKASSVTLLYTSGIKSYLEKRAANATLISPILHFRDGQGDDWSSEIALVWSTGTGENVRSYSNNTFNQDGGTHLTGFRTGLTRLITSYAKEHGLDRDLPDGLIGSDIRDGLIGVVNIRLPGLSFSSQTKDKLVTPGARLAVENLFRDQVDYWFSTNPGAAKKIAERAVLCARAREAARRAKSAVLRKSYTDRLSLPGKLADCASKDPSVSELIIVEGDSAGGSSKGARDRRFQAILPLRGKVLNCERAGLETMLNNTEITTIITAMGCGIEQNRTFDQSQLRYHKIIIATDADVDGAHIRTLLLTFFYRSMPRLVMEGHIYIALPPLYGARITGPRNQYYFSGEEDLELFRATLTAAQNRKLKISRYKGLGEMNPNELWATTLDPEARVLKQVEVQDAVAAEQVFDVLMGDKVDPRKRWIDENAQYATIDL